MAKNKGRPRAALDAEPAAYVPPTPQPCKIGCIRITVSVEDHSGDVVRGCQASARVGSAPWLIELQDLDKDNQLCVRQSQAGSLVEATGLDAHGRRFYGRVAFPSGFRVDERVTFVLLPCTHAGTA